MNHIRDGYNGSFANFSRVLAETELGVIGVCGRGSNHRRAVYLLTPDNNIVILVGCREEFMQIRPH